MLTALVGLVGCAPAAQPSEAHLDPETRRQVREAVQALDYPFESDPAYAVRLANLQARLIDECVVREGVVPPGREDLPLTSADLAPSESRLWLLPGDDYGVAAALDDPAVLAGLVAGESGTTGSGRAAPDPVAYDRAVYGPEDERISFPVEDGATVSVPVGGCFGEATATMYGVEAADYERTYSAMPTIRGVLAEVVADGGVRSATAAWSTCMGEAGIEVSAPGDLYATISAWVGGVLSGTLRVAQVAEQESALAAQDGACRTSSGLGAAVATVFLETATEAIRGSEGVVQEYRAMVEHAQSVMGRG
ncbi:hypothetical protein [Cellulomonas triticagri]|uniref:Uncharacterized protein n=1 Tax=Cellulomonas triticagri TaxID=2483352 RepID=A0A3M2JGS2_9CELL|nr:hypothetical protein [Cellulomonas triticagri]RMI12789.1 hypothetical protein EBM89_07155 [Cellulomonas triticagri]